MLRLSSGDVLRTEGVNVLAECAPQSTCSLSCISKPGISRELLVCYNDIGLVILTPRALSFPVCFVNANGLISLPHQAETQLEMRSPCVHEGFLRRKPKVCVAESRG